MTDAEVKNLVSKRGQIKAQLTRFNTYINTSSNQSNILKIQTRLEKVELAWKEFDTVQSQLENLLGNDPSQEFERAAFEDVYFENVVNAKQLIANLKQDSNLTPSSNLSNSDAHTINNVKLPTLNLPTFTGNYEEYMSFFDTFNSLIHKNNALSNIQKFHYLRSSLKGEAEKVIQSLEVSASNYIVAWDLLKERYENRRLIIHNHIKALFEYNPIGKESPVTLRQLLDHFVKHLRALGVLKQPVNQWDTPLLYLISTKLDAVTKREWESSVIGNDAPTWDAFIKFLTNRCQLLETLSTNISGNTNPSSSNSNKKPHHKDKRNDRVTALVSTSGPICEFCKSAHTIYKCQQFLKLSVRKRAEEVQKLKLCSNCLRRHDENGQCKTSTCRVCNKGHNTLLHTETNTVVEQPSANMATNGAFKLERHVLLSTAIVYAFDVNGAAHECRVLLDSGSQLHFITTRFAQMLDLKTSKLNVPITGVNQTLIKVNYQTQVKLKSKFNNFTSTLNCLILPEITGTLPDVRLDIKGMNIPNHVNLADPTFHLPGKIDMLIGNELFWDLLCEEQLHCGPQQPLLRNTVFGWIAGGSIKQPPKPTKPKVCNLSTEYRIEEQLKQFWQIEEIGPHPKFTEEEAACEKHFKENTRRDETGRFIVALPIRDHCGNLGDSKKQALKRFQSLQRRLQRQPDMNKLYIEFIEEYERLGHMTRAPRDTPNANRISYFLPHHAVVKPLSTTTKVRVVFDGSAKSDTGISLNDTLLVGPTIQEDIFSIVIRFRTYRYVFTADIAKMYRQIWVREEDRHLQQILWRPDTEGPIESYRLNTVTYGTASAPFLAVRCLQQLALENQDEFPEASDAIRHCFYVDDILTGANTLEKTIQLKQEVTNILSTAGFELRKFSSNDHRVLDSSSTMQENEAVFSITRTDEIKTLGLQWNTKLDALQYTESVQPELSRITKRKILSIISQLYDPLGLLGPIIIKAKILLQKLWQLQLDWDASIPSTLCTEWRELQSELPAIRGLHIPRHVFGNNVSHIQLHGFCDASEVAYGAAIYVRSTNDDGTHQGHLLCAKSRVAPLRTMSLPRLELCGALLLAQLMSKTQQILSVNSNHIFYWCDSTIALAWICAPPHHWQTFVGNRVAAIQELTKSTSWRHVRSEANPADAISRGITPNQLEHHKLWWNGPSWLCQEEHHWPVLHKPEVIDMPEKRKMICTMTRSADANDEIFSYYSSFTKLQRVVAYLLRFRNNVSVPRKERKTTVLSNQELQASVRCLVKLAQAEEFGRDIAALQSNQNIPRCSKLLTLNPFLDEHGIVRVGGRLTNADLAYTHKHPAVLPQKHPLTKLLILHEHAYLLHAGQQAVLASLRRQFWPLCARSVVKKTLRTCVNCFRVNPRPCENLMGNLPRDRTTPSRPFQKCGVDYAGPFLLKEGRSRTQKLVKAYLCLFVCFSTKAVHLEIVSDLTSECFLNALKRFMSRRGKCSDIYSDNATTFVGTNNKLKEVKNFLVSQQTKISEFLSKDLINWHFVPSRAPHFGGLWEAAVKSAKGHLKRVIGDAALTVEGFSTVIIQIEACLNSRPISPLSEDPNDLAPLTPGHFLIGDSLVALPEDSLEDVPPARLSHYQRLQQMMQHFWTRWHKEYLHNLQQRHKWHQRSGSLLKPGALVIIREDNSPPLKWNMGRIVKLYPGQDNVCRVVDVQTRQGVLKRPVAKLCLLPVE